jgi:probable rRNA maturation factor
MPISFHTADIKFTLKNKRRLRAFIGQQLKSKGIGQFNLSYVFCSDEYLLAINQKFLGHDYYTDIITFPLSEKDALEAEMYISVDRVKENASSLLKTNAFIAQRIENELVRVIFHGILHLLGYQDKTKYQKLRMRSAEDEWLILYSNVPHGTLKP